MNTNLVEDFFNTPSNYLVKRYGLLIRRDLIKLLLKGEDFRNKTIADIGCGDGSLSVPFLGISKSLTLIDIAQPMLDLAKQNMIRQWGEADLIKLRLWRGDIRERNQDDQFDLILVIGVLAHVDNVQLFMECIYKVLEPDGKVVIQLSTWFHPLIIFSSIMSHRKYKVNRLSLSEVKKIVEHCGFEIKGSRQYSFPFPGMRFLNDNFLYRIQSFFLMNKAFSWLCSDHLIVLQKKLSSK